MPDSLNDKQIEIADGKNMAAMDEGKPVSMISDERLTELESEAAMFRHLEKIATLTWEGGRYEALIDRLYAETFRAAVLREMSQTQENEDGK